MTQHRISFKRVNDLCNLLEYRLVKHQWLGKTDYFYNYSLVKDENGRYKETILSKTSLKNIFEWLLENGINYSK
jgi:hypothetical protein